MLNPILDIRNVLENCDVEWKRGWFWLRIKKGLNCRKGPSPCPEFSLLLSVKFFLSVQHLHLSFLRSLFWKGTTPQQRAWNITGILFIKIPYFSCFAAQKLQKDSIGEHRTVNKVTRLIDIGFRLPGNFNTKIVFKFNSKLDFLDILENFVNYVKNLFRGHTELNHGPLNLQSNALPLSYTPPQASRGQWQKYIANIKDNGSHRGSKGGPGPPIFGTMKISAFLESKW